jgi:hypothetical protein
MAALSRVPWLSGDAAAKKAWMAGTSPAMTLKSQLDVTGICSSRTNRKMMKK